MFGGGREKNFPLMHLYMKTVYMTQYKTVKPLWLFLYLPMSGAGVWTPYSKTVVLREKKKNPYVMD